MNHTELTFEEFLQYGLPRCHGYKSSDKISKQSVELQDRIVSQFMLNNQSINDLLATMGLEPLEMFVNEYDLTMDRCEIHGPYVKHKHTESGNTMNESSCPACEYIHFEFADPSMSTSDPVLVIEHNENGTTVSDIDHE